MELSGGDVHMERRIMSLYHDEYPKLYHPEIYN